MRPAQRSRRSARGLVFRNAMQSQGLTQGNIAQRVSCEQGTSIKGLFPLTRIGCTLGRFYRKCWGDKHIRYTRTLVFSVGVWGRHKNTNSTFHFNAQTSHLMEAWTDLPVTRIQKSLCLPPPRHPKKPHSGRLHTLRLHLSRLDDARKRRHRLLHVLW